MTKYVLTVFIVISIFCPVFSQTMQDTIFSYKTKNPVIIDGQATENCWQNAEWRSINQILIPYGATMEQGDFEGRFKTAWDEDFLYILVEVVDDSLSDDHQNPFDRYYDDDCVEVFIDENRSMGDHERNYNAFAYHVSLFYDAIDLGDSWSEVNLKDNLSVDMDTIAQYTYLWEMAFKMYDASFNISSSEDSRVFLTHNKLMGFAIAYCDNDETTVRENFIGSMEMPPPPNNNNMYKNADYFGPLLCIDQDIYTASETIPVSEDIEIYPVPANDIIQIKLNKEAFQNNNIAIMSASGRLVEEKTFWGNTFQVDIENLEAGIYIIRIEHGTKTFEKKIIKQ
jgi:hypothetical protein